MRILLLAGEDEHAKGKDTLEEVNVTGMAMAICSFVSNLEPRFWSEFPNPGPVGFNTDHHVTHSHLWRVIGIINGDV